MIKSYTTYGASLKDLGTRWFAISKMLDANYIGELKTTCK